MGNTMEIFLPRFGVTRMAQKDEKDILVEYSKNKLMFQLWTCDTSYKPFFYRKYDGDIFTLILRHQNDLERREGHPG